MSKFTQEVATGDPSCRKGAPLQPNSRARPSLSVIYQLCTAAGDRADNAATAGTLAPPEMLTEGTAAVVSHRGTPSLTTGEEERREGEEKYAYAMIYIKMGH